MRLFPHHRMTCASLSFGGRPMLNPKPILFFALLAILPGCKLELMGLEYNPTGPSGAIVNGAPQLSAQYFRMNEDAQLDAQLEATDENADAITFIVVQNPEHGSLSLDVGTGRFQYQPDNNFFGEDGFTIIARDGALESSPARISLEIREVNDAPVASNGVFSTNEDANKDSALSASDIDGNALTYSIMSAPQNGVIQNLNASTGVFTYVTNLNANGADSFTFKASDGSADSNVATVSITINAVNYAPVASNEVLNNAFLRG